MRRVHGRRRRHRDERIRRHAAAPRDDASGSADGVHVVARGDAGAGRRDHHEHALSGGPWAPQRRLRRGADLRRRRALRDCREPEPPRGHRRVRAGVHALRRHGALPGRAPDHADEDHAAGCARRASAGVHQPEPANARGADRRPHGADRRERHRPAAHGRAGREARQGESPPLFRRAAGLLRAAHAGRDPDAPTGRLPRRGRDRGRRDSRGRHHDPRRGHGQRRPLPRGFPRVG